MVVAMIFGPNSPTSLRNMYEMRDEKKGAAETPLSWWI